MKILMLKLNLTFQQGPVLSPLRESPWQSNEETSKSLEGHSFDGIIIYFFELPFLEQNTDVCPDCARFQIH